VVVLGIKQVWLQCYSNKGSHHASVTKQKEGFQVAKNEQELGKSRATGIWTQKAWCARAGQWFENTFCW